ncbi:restriction endonuclease [Candidatus Gracilibacteria bacterium]|nr:restriction endonuclease [Candidatus Gracilibacteria bacterium]NJP19006.1 restriction endonuclease [Hydrococcus sp. CRU_1_1]
MKFSPVFKQYLGCSDESEVFKYFKDSLTDSITVWDYFVDWKKVIKNFKEIEINLNLLNYLIGKDNLEEELRQLLKQYPKIARTIPILLACRTANFKILTEYAGGKFNHECFNFSHKGTINDKDIETIVIFTKKTGILDIFRNKIIKSIPDYVLGVEVGLDSNGRKNRSGTTMETIVKNILQPICQKNNFSLISQATPSKLEQDWGVTVKVDKANRKFDFAVKTEKALYLIETNFYGGGGSKLKATAGEYKGLFDVISSQGHKFIWITDGLGWKSSLRSLEETFDRIDYTFNLKTISTGLLAEIIVQQL